MAGSSQPRRAARLAAVQALYQIEMTGRAPDEVIEEFEAHRLDAAAGGPARVDHELFADIVRGTEAARAALEPLVREALAEGWSLERLGATLRALLCAGAWELRDRADIPPRATISEYVAIARGFVGADETGFVNGVLDSLAHTLRGPEMTTDAGAARPDGDGEDAEKVR